MNIKPFSAVTADTEVADPMIAYRAKLVSYLADRKSICDTFFTDAAVAEETCDIATRCANTGKEQAAAQVAFQARIRIVAWIRSEAIKELGLPPDLPIHN